MRNTKLKYKGFIGEAQYSDLAQKYYGSILNTNDLVSYEAKTLTGLAKEFRKTVDVYIDTCAQVGIEKLFDPKLFYQCKFYIFIKIVKNLFTLKMLEDIHFPNVKKILTNKNSYGYVFYDKKLKSFSSVVKHNGKWYELKSKTLDELNRNFKDLTNGIRKRKYIKLK